MSKYWSDVAKRLTPYIPGEQPQHERLVKLNTNECPFPPAPGVTQAIAAVSNDELRRYPDPDSQALRQALADRNGLASEQVFLGNGSDEVLAHVFLGLLKQDKPLLFPDISYSFYPVWCELYGIRYQTVALSDDYTVNPADYAVSNGGIILPNPNAPTGILLPLADIRRLLEANADVVVVVDEAYIDFGGESAVALINDYENLLVVQTLSKSRALAGIRVGAAFAQSQLIEALQRVKDSFNSYPLNVLSQRAALASIEDERYFQACCERVMALREALTANLTSLGFRVLPSTANFILASPPQGDAEDLFHALRDSGVIVRYFNKPRLSGFLRISIGDENDSARLLEVVRQWLSAKLS